MVRLALLVVLVSASGCDGDPPLRPEPGTWRVVLLPDTQCYSLRYPEIFEAQGEFVAREAERLDIRAVVHLGDITENNVPEQWEVAARALAPLRGRVPLLLAPGNHDLGEGGSARERTSMMAAHFPLADQMATPTFVEAFDDSPWNVAHRVEGDRVSFVIVDLEFGPRGAVLDWAADVLSRHDDALAIVATHAFLDGDGQRYDHRSGAEQPFCPHDYGVAADEVNDGEEIWQRLVSPAASARLVVSGHVPNGFASRSDVGAAGQRVHQLMADWQTGTRCPEEGGDGRGYLVVLEVTERDDRVDVDVLAYSPWEDRFETEREQRLELALP